MNKFRTAIGYLIFSIVMIATLFYFSENKINPWYSGLSGFISVIFSLIVKPRLATKFVILISISVSFLAPLLLLYLIGFESEIKETPLQYLGIIDYLQLLIPTLIAIITLEILKRFDFPSGIKR